MSQTLKPFNTIDPNSLTEYGFRRAIITVTVVICCLLELIDTTIVNVATNTLMGNLGATVSEVSWVIAAYAIANVIVVPLSGWLSAQFGRKYYYGGSVILFTIGSLLCGTSTSIWELVFFRFIQGLGGGALFATSQSILVEIYPKEKLGMANAMFGMGVIIGPTIGPLLGGYLIDNFAWPIMFFVNIPIGILAAFLTFKYIRNNPYHIKSGSIDWLGILLLIAGIGSMQMVLEQGEREDWFESRMITSFAILSVVGIVLFIWRMLKVKNPIVDLRVLKRGNVAIGVVMNFMLGFGLFGSVFIIPLFVQRYLGYTATMTGALFTPGAFLAGMMMPIVGRMLMGGVDSKRMITFGFSMFAIFTFWCSMVLGPTTGADDFFWPLMLRGLGMSMLFVPMANLTLSGLQGREIAQGAGLSNMVRQIGGSFGVAIIAALSENLTAQHKADIALHVTNFSTLTSDRLNAISQGFSRITSDPVRIEQMANSYLNFTVDRQAAVLSYINIFQYIAVFLMLCIPLLVFARTRKSGKVDMGAH